MIQPPKMPPLALMSDQASDPCVRRAGGSRRDGAAPPAFHPVPPPGTGDLQALVRRIAAVGPRAGQKAFTLISSPESAPSSNGCVAT